MYFIVFPAEHMLIINKYDAIFRVVLSLDWNKKIIKT